MLHKPQGHFGDLTWDGVLSNAMERPEWWPGYKPPAAFWTSTLREDGTTPWREYLGGIDCSADACFVFEVVGEPRVLMLRTDDDLQAAARNLGMEAEAEWLPRLWDRAVMEAFWDKMAEVYDAIHVPEKHDRFGCLNGWDCESTAWLRPADHLRLVAIKPVAEPEDENAVEPGH